MKDIIIIISEQRNQYNTWHSNSVSVPIGKASTVYQSMLFKGPGVNIWNSYRNILHFYIKEQIEGVYID